MFIADLGIRVGSDAVKVAKGRLDRLTVSGGKAEDAVDGLGRGARRSMGGVALLSKAVVGLGAAIGTAGLATAFVSEGRQTSKALAEVSTLIEGTTEQQEALTRASEEFVRKFGGNVAGQLQGFYTTISAGAGSVEEAAVTLEQANKLAKGGVTDVATAVDGLTSVLNAYGDGVDGAAAVSDAMFVAMRAGKTTIGELSANLGGVAPLAVSAGVSFDELVASIAALTKGGISTAESVTGVRAILAAVTKPSSEAAKLAKALGLEFNSAAIQAKGFAGFMDDVVAKTGGSNDALAMLFGGVEAIIPAMAFAGQAGADFNTILDDMANKAGATDTAVEKIASSLDDRLNVQLSRYAVYASQAGTALLAVLVPAMEGLGDAIDIVADNSDILGAALVGLTATQIPALVGGLTTLVRGLNLAAGAARAMGAAMSIAGGPLGIAVGLIAAAASYFLLFRDNAGEAETAAYDAEAGTKALNEALDAFNAGSAAAGANAIALANDNYKLAASARDAAAAAIEQAKAQLAAVKANNNLRGRNERSRVVELNAEIAEQEAALAAAQAALDEAAAQRKETHAVVGSDYTTPLGTIDLPPVDTSVLDNVASILDGLSGGTSSAAKGAGKKAADEVDEVTEAVRRYQQGIEGASSAVADLILGQQSWEDFTRESVNRVVREQIEGTLNTALQSLVEKFGGAASGDSSGGWLATALATLFGGAKAPSYDGGGYTGSGSRTGGVDGKGGFWAINHPDETIVDHTKGQGMAANVNVPINVINQNGSKVQTRRNSDGGATIRVMDERIDAYMRGPKGKRTMQQDYGVRPSTKGG